MLTTLLLACAAQDRPPLRWEVTHAAREAADRVELEVALVDGSGQLLVEGWSVSASQQREGRTHLSTVSIDDERGDGRLELAAGPALLTVTTPRGTPYILRSVELDPETCTSVVVTLHGPDPSTSIYVEVPDSSLELLGEDGRIVASHQGRSVRLSPLEVDRRIWVAAELDDTTYELDVDRPHLDLLEPVHCQTGDKARVVVVGRSSLKLVAPDGSEPLAAPRAFRRRRGGEAWAQSGRWDDNGAARAPLLDRLPAGDYTVLVQHACGTKRAYDVIGLGPAEERELVLDSPSVRQVRLELVTASGEPLVHQPFSIRSAQRSIPGAERLQAYAKRRFGDAVALLDSVVTSSITGEDGSVTLDAVALGPHELEVRPEAWFPSRIPIEVREGEAVVRAVLPPAADLELIVEGVEAAGSGELVVAMAPEGGKVRLSPDSLRRLDDEGRCTFRLVPHGAMTFIVVRRAGRGRQDLLLVESVEIDAATPSPLRLRVEP